MLGVHFSFVSSWIYLTPISWSGEGELFANTAGGDFTPHVVTVNTGEVLIFLASLLVYLCLNKERKISVGILNIFLFWADRDCICYLQDVASKILSFSQKGPRGICVLSANGAVSNVTIRQPGSSGGILTYEAWFLSPSFFLSKFLDFFSYFLNSDQVNDIPLYLVSNFADGKLFFFFSVPLLVLS